MLELFENFEFLRPFMLLLSIPVVLLVYVWHPKFVSHSAWQKICAPKFLAYLSDQTKKDSIKTLRVLVLCALLSAVFALAGPSFQKKEEPTLVAQNPVMILLDLSSDMNRTDIRPSRLGRAKIVITDILKNALAKPSGLIVYTAEPFLVSPLSEDAQVIINILKAVETNIMPIEGNRLDRAIDFAKNRLLQSGFYQGNIVVFTSSSENESAVLLAAKKAKEKNFDVSVVDMSVVPSAFLQQLAKKGGGIYFNATQNNAQALIDLLDKGNTTNKQSKNTMLVAIDNGYIFVFLPAFFILLLFKKGFFGCFLLMLLCFDANAGVFFNADQEGEILYSSGQYQKAALKFKDEKWQASSYYKAGDYKKAASLFAKYQDTESLYNKANALAKAGQINEAIQNYETVLKKDPKHEDARFNLEYLKKLQQNQEKEQQEQKKDEQNKQTQNDMNNSKNDNTPNENEQNQQKNDNDNQDTLQDENQENTQDKDSKQDQSDEEQQESLKDISEQDTRQSDQSLEEKKEPVLPAKQEEADKYDETVQAREQKFRQIKDDPGGLLRAFIKQEYLKKRY